MYLDIVNGFILKMMYTLLFLCIQMLNANSVGKVINSQEIQQNHKEEEIWFYVKLTEERADNCTQNCVAETNTNDSLLLATQIAMSAALAIGIFTMFVLFWKICSNTYRWRRPRRRRREPFRNRTSVHSEGSVDSIQQVVAERLRDAPPNYIRAMLLSSDDTPPPYNLISSAHPNPCFDPDYSTPPPSYSAALEQESSPTENTHRSSNKSNTELPIRVDLPKEAENSPDPTLHI